jgi:hypothetical protein
MAHTTATEIRVRSSLAVILAILALSACGGSSGAVQSTASIAGASQSAASSPAVAGAIVRADAICRRLNTELTAKRPKSVSVKEIESISPRNATLEQKAVNELAKLSAPTVIVREWRQVIAYRRSLAGALIALTGAARAGDTARIKKLGQAKASVRKKLLEVGKHIGFTSCQELG